jgi:hypothetical protein
VFARMMGIGNDARLSLGARLNAIDDC